MNNNIEYKQLRNEEIDIYEILLTLWQGKWLIVGTTAIFFACTLIYVQFFKTYTVTIDIKPIASYETISYAELNYLLNQAEHENLTTEEKKKYDIESQPKITAQILFDLLIERVTNRKDFVQAVKELNYLESKNGNEEEWNLSINEFIYNIQFLDLTPKEDVAKNKSLNNLLNWQIKVEGLRDPIRYKRVLELALNKSNEFVRKEMQSNIEQTIRLLKIKQTQDIEDIDIKIKGVREDYKSKVDNRIAYLKEQSQIARQLGIAKSTIEAQSFDSTINMITTLQVDNPFYLRGYEAIEKEMKLLETRTTVDEFIPELIELNQKRRALAEDKLQQRIIKALQVSSIRQDNKFIAANYDLEKIKVKRSFNQNYILLLSILIGLSISVIILLIRKLINKQLKSGKY